MKFIIFILKSSLDGVRDTVKVVMYFNLIKHNNFFVLFNFFFIRLFCTFSSIRNFKKVKTNKLICKEIYFDDSKINIGKIINDMDDSGYSKLLKLKSNYVKDIKELIFKNQNYDLKKIKKYDEDLKKNLDESLNEYLFRLKKLKISRLTGTINLKEENILKDILTSKTIVEVAKSYLNTKTLSINATYFISNPIEVAEAEKYKNAQYFHWDNDFTKFFKFYIYLSDVDMGSGPHVFIPYTHKFKKKEHRLCRLYNDASIFSSYEDKKYFTGKAGTSFFVDSYGLHKGETPLNNYRLMINVHFGKGKLLYSKDDLYIKV